MDSPPPGTWRLLAPALLLWGVAAIAITIPGSGVWVVLAGAGGGGCAAVLACLGTRAAGRGALLLWSGLLLLLGSQMLVGQTVRDDPVLVEASAEGRSVSLRVELLGFEHPGNDPSRVSSWVAARTVPSPEGPSAGVPVLLWLDEPLGDAAAIGRVLTLTGQVVALRSESPAAFGIRVRGSPVAVVEAPWNVNPAAVAVLLRKGLLDVAARTAGAELIPGFAVGDTSLVPADLDSAMRETSLTHVTAVSGSNCALVTGAIVWVLARLGVGRRTRIVAAGIALGGFVLLVGPDASVQRAAVMATVILASGFGGKRSIALPGLGVAMIVLLCASPWQALQPGFALSVAATLGILVGAPPCERALRRRLRLPRLLALPLAVAIVAQLACAPLLLLLQPGLPMTGVVANLLVAPAIPIATGLGLLGAMAAVPTPDVAHWLVLGARPFAQWVDLIATSLAHAPFARWYWPGGWFGCLLLAACETIGLLAWGVARGRLVMPGIPRKPPRSPWRQAPPVPLSTRVTVAVGGCLALGVIVGTAFVTPVATRVATPADWAVVMCDVGQGDALLLRDPDHPEEVMLVDTGDDPEALVRCLDRFGVDRIAVLVLTHDDRDHVGAVAEIRERVALAIVAPSSVGQESDGRPLLRLLRGAKIPIDFGSAGDGSRNQSPTEGLVWRLLAPPAEETPRTANAASLVLLVEAGDLTILLLADTGEQEQERLRLAYPSLRVDVVKVAHHGSRDQSSALYRSLGARLALVSVGESNRYGHPASETLQALRASGGEILRSDRSGTVVVRRRVGDRLQIWVETPDGTPPLSSNVGTAP